MHQATMHAFVQTFGVCMCVCVYMYMYVLVSRI